METVRTDRSDGSDDAHVETEERVTPLELFFDLVFVFAITQVTGLMIHSPDWTGLAQGMAVLAAVWWAWVAYGWLTDSVDPNVGVVRTAMFAAMAGMFVAALAAPQAFGRYGLLFACAYFVVRALHIVIYSYASPTRDLEAAVRRLAPGVLIGSGLLIAAGTQAGATKAVLWGLALCIDYLAPVLGGMEGWRVQPAHFAERYGLIVIIALGESVIAIGLGLSGVRLDAGLLLGAVLGLAVAACLWWAYFDVVALVAGRKLGSLRGRAQSALARDSYSYLHLPMIAGIVLLAFGVRSTIADAYHPLAAVAAAALCGGVALYFAGHIAFRLRNVGSWNHQRAVLVLACLALIPLATQIEALISLGALALLCAGLTVYETLRFREARARVRAGGLPESMLPDPAAARR